MRRSLAIAAIDVAIVDAAGGISFVAPYLIV